VTALDDQVRQGLVAAGIPVELVDGVVDAFIEAKRRFYLDDLRPSAIEGARFSEAVFRIMEWATTQTYTPLGKDLPKVPTLIGRLEQAVTAPDSVRFHIPRTLRLIYDIRNKRDVAHLADGINPNYQDATLIVRNMDWVMAELVRLYHNVSPTEAHGIITDLVSKDVPSIQMFDVPRILKQLKASDHVLVLLYWRGREGATYAELHSWARAPMRSNLRRTITTLDNKDLIHLQDDRYVLTHLGERDVEQRKLIDPQ
jgi:hypothetical protein